MTTTAHRPQLKLLVGSWHLLTQVMPFDIPTNGGFSSMREALQAVCELNTELKAKYGIEFAVSGHWWHEIQVPRDGGLIGATANWNNSRAIDLREWQQGIEGRKFPRIGRIIPPGFGLPGSDDGALTNPDSTRRELAVSMIARSLRTSDFLKQKGMAEGEVIVWTGPDGLKRERVTAGEDTLLGYEYNPNLPEWKDFVSGIVDAINRANFSGKNGSKILFESKYGGDPCYLDVFTDPCLEVRAINEINQRVGRKVVWWQGEVCHTRGGGVPFWEALQYAIENEVFDGQIHFNSGGLGQVDFRKLLREPGGTKMSLFPQYVDPDFLPGEGVDEWVGDQVRTLSVGAMWSGETGKPLEVEFDARFCRYPDTIDRLRESAIWTIDRFREASAKAG